MSELKEGEDYYLNEDGLLVFTSVYHLKRGYCCQNGCKHCPYPKEEKPDSKPKIDPSVRSKIKQD